MSFSRYFENGQKGTAENWTQWFGDYFSNFVGSGYTITEDTGLDISISAGRAYIKNEDGLMFQIISSEAETLTLTDNATNYIYLHCDNGSSWLTDSTSATVPDDAMLLGVVTTDTGAITEISNTARTTPLSKSQNILVDYTMSLPSYLGDYSTTVIAEKILNFNPFYDKIGTIEKVMGTFTKPSAYGAVSVKIEYNVGNGDVEIYNQTISYNNPQTVSFEINETCVSEQKDCYVKLTLTQVKQGTSGGSYRASSITATNFYVSYNIQ